LSPVYGIVIVLVVVVVVVVVAVAVAAAVAAAAVVVDVLLFLLYFSFVLFSSRVSILTRDIDISNMSVCLSVRNVPVLNENGLTYCHTCFTVR